VKAFDEEILDEVWGAIIIDYDFSVVEHTLEARVKVEDATETKGFVFSMKGIEYFEFTDEDPIQWDYIELSEVYVAAEGDCRLRFDFVFWLGAAHLTVVCAAAAVEAAD
jgi:hypothetical protein